MNNTLLYFGSFLVVVLAALFAVPAFVDWNGYRGVFEEEASKVLGRDVRVGGAVNVRLLPTPFVRFEKVRLSDLTGQTGEPFVRAESFTMRLAVAPLLRGVLEANEIELTRPVLTLAFDGKGGGNWSSIELKPGALPFVPQNVALNSVKIIDGVLALYNPEAKPVSRIEAVNGELSADSLKGPFKFKGIATWSGVQREVKFATTVPELDGAVRIKATTRAQNLANTFTLDGKLEDLAGKPRLSGDLTGKIAVPGSELITTDGKAAESGETLVMDFKSNIAADASGASFDDIAMALDNAAEPQLIAGAAKASWAGEPRFDLALNAKWLDLDRLSGAGQESANFSKIKQLGLGVMKAVAGDVAAGAKVDVEQVKIGGETAGGLKIDAERLGGVVKLTALKVGLPGGSRLDLAGEVKDDAGKLSFAGNSVVHGTSLSRLLAWAEKSGVKIDVKADGAFTAGGNLSISDTAFQLTEATAEVAGKPVSGEFRMSDDGRSKIAVILEAASLDSAELLPETARALEAEVRNVFGLGAAPAETNKGAVSAASGGGSDVTLRILAGQLKHGTETFRNVDATLGFEGGDVRVPSARFTTIGGARAALEGYINNANREPTGRLAYELDGATPEALKDIAAVFGLGGVVSAARLARLGAGKVAGLIRLGERGKGTADITLDGTLASARVAGSAEFDSGLKAWRTAPSRVRVSAKASDLGKLVTAIGAADHLTVSGMDRPAELVFATTGPLATGAVTLIDVTSDGLQSAFSGTTQWAEAKDAAADGVVTFKAREMREVLALAGIDSAGGIAGTGASGRITIARKDGAWQLASQRLSLGSAIVSGTANVTRDTDGVAKISADIAADRVSVASLLAALVDQASSKPAVTRIAEESETAPGAPGASATVWPEGSFNLAGLGASTGEVRIKFAKLHVTDHLTAHDGAMTVALSPGKISVTELSGTGAGGKLSSKIDLEKGAGGVSFNGQFKLDAMELAHLSPLAKGRATLSATAESRGLSPAGLMATLAGKGELVLNEALIPGPAPRTGADIADAVLQNEIANEPAAVSGALQGLLTEATVDAGTRSVGLNITNGIAKFDAAELETSEGKLSVLGSADLTTLAFNSTWLLAPIVTPLPPPTDPALAAGWLPPPVKGPLPPATVAYNGRLDALSGLQTTIDVTELQRELAVRQMERNVEELERLRRADELRARQELERRKALEAERAAAAAAARALRNGVPLPPVLPDSNGVAPGVNGSGAAVGAQQVPPQGQGATSASPVSAPIDATSNSAGAAPPAKDTYDARPQGVSRPAVAAPKPAPRPQRRTTADEIMRALGGFP